MYLFVGLGNPGPQYAKQRHNVGFMAMDEIQSSYGFPPEREKFGGLLSEGSIEHHKILCFKPLSYMNRSGIPLAKLICFYKIPLEQVFVFHDDLDLTFAKVRFKYAGGHGGHNGLRSLDQHIGKAYGRVRIGIDHPGHKDRVSGYVLNDFSKAEAPEIQLLLEMIADEVHLLLSACPNEFVSKVMQP